MGGSKRRSFYLAPAIVPIVAAGFLYAFGRSTAALVVAAIGVVLLLLAAVAPPLFRRATELLRKLGIALGRVFSAAVLTTVYVVVFLPAGLIARLRGSEARGTTRPKRGRTLFTKVPIADEPSLFERQFAREVYLRSGTKSRPWVRSLRIVVTTLVVFVAVDLVAWTAIRHAWYALTGAPADGRAQTAPYRDTEWGDDYWQEFRTAFSVAYRPYVGWRRRDHQGRHITITNGLRKTWASPGGAAGARTRIYVFGGSTVWGTGARDDATIPSWLARIGDEQGRNYEVTNLGDSGYVSWQQALLLSELCASGDIPDVVVFYDGVNDVFAKLQSPNSPRPPQNLARSARWFSAFRDKYTPLQGLAVVYRHNSLLFQTLRRSATPAFTEAEQAGAAEITRWVAEDHGQTRRFVRALADGFGFEVIHVWQPSVFTKEPLTDEERGHAQRPGKFPPDLLASVYRNATLAIGPSDDVIDASDALDGVEQTVFIDWIHISEEGNRRVAQVIADELASRQRPATMP